LAMATLMVTVARLVSGGADDVVASPDLLAWHWFVTLKVIVTLLCLNVLFVVTQRPAVSRRWLMTCQGDRRLRWRDSRAAGRWRVHTAWRGQRRHGCSYSIAR
jgi:hypothetical protein